MCYGPRWASSFDVWCQHRFSLDFRDMAAGLFLYCSAAKGTTGTVQDGHSPRLGSDDLTYCHAHLINSL